MTAYSWHAVLMTAFDNLSHACSSIKSIQSTQFEQLTRTSQCLLMLIVSGVCLNLILDKFGLDKYQDET